MSRQLTVIGRSIQTASAAQRALAVQRRPRHNAWSDPGGCTALGKALLVPILSPGRDVFKGIELRDKDSLRPIQRFYAACEEACHSSKIEAQCISADGQSLIASVYFSRNGGGSGAYLYIWDLQTGKQAGLLKQIQSDKTLRVCEDTGRVYYEANDFSNKRYAVKALDLTTGQSQTVFDNGACIHAFDISKDGNRIIVSDPKKRIRIADAQTGAVIYSMYYSTDKGWVRRIALSKTGSIAVTGSDDGTLGVVDAAAKRVLLRINLHTVLGIRFPEKIRKLRFEYVQVSSDDKYAAAVYMHTMRNRMGLVVCDIARQEIRLHITNETACGLYGDDLDQIESLRFTSEEAGQMSGEYRAAALKCAVSQQYNLTLSRVRADVQQCSVNGRVAFNRRLDLAQGTVSEHKRVVQVLDPERLAFDELEYDGGWFNSMRLSANIVLIEFTEDDIHHFNLWDLDEKQLAAKYKFYKKENENFLLAGRCTAAYRLHGSKKFDKDTKRFIWKDVRSEVFTFSAYSSAGQLGEHGEKTSCILKERVMEMSETLLFTAAHSDRRLNVYTRENTYIGCVDAPEGSTVVSVKCSSDPNAFYVVFSGRRYVRFEVREQAIVQADFDYQTPGIPPLKFDQTILESGDGRYIITEDEKRISLYDYQKKRCVYRRQPELHNAGSASTLRLRVLDPQMRFLMIDSGDGRFDFVDPFSLAQLATLTLMWQGKWLWTTPPDPVAPDGWFYTNAPEALNIYRQNADGSAQVLNPKEPARAEYILKYGRRDMVKKRLLAHKSFRDDIDRIALAAANPKRIADMRHCRALPYTGEG